MLHIYQSNFDEETPTICSVDEIECKLFAIRREDSEGFYILIIRKVCLITDVE